jgi:acyl-CoA thioesterase-1
VVGAAAALALPAAAASARTPVVAVLGDSITAGYGLPSSQALPVQLQAALASAGAAAKVVGLGVNGDTTAGGLRRVDRVPAETDVCVVALGGNDLMLGVHPSQIRANLDGIVRKLKARGITVVLAGMRAPPLFGDFAAQFDAAFRDVAREHKLAFYPFLLDGIFLDARYNLEDRVHPNAQGVRIIAERLAPVVAKVLRTEA